MEKEQIQERNALKWIRFINKAKALECTLFQRGRDKTHRAVYEFKIGVRTQGPKPFIFGFTDTGRAIFIEPMMVGVFKINPQVAQFMQHAESMGCIVGTAYDESDCWDIIDQRDHISRKKRTYRYRKEVVKND